MTTRDVGAAAATMINLPMDLTIECVQALRAELVDALQLQAPLHLDAAAVDRCDTAGLQLLLAACRASAGSTVRIFNAPASMSSAATALGLIDLLDLAPTETLLHA